MFLTLLAVYVVGLFITSLLDGKFNLTDSQPHESFPMWFSVLWFILVPLWFIITTAEKLYLFGVSKRKTKE